MSLFTSPIATLEGQPSSLASYEGDVLLLVNVASKCGLTPQYEGLEALAREYAERGVHVLGFPCNQFMEQEPGTSEEIRAFCSSTYGVTFPLFEKIEVNGEHRHPIYRELVTVSDATGYVGDVRWNFEKFLVGRDGTVQRFAPQVEPHDPSLIAAIEAALA